MGKHTASVHALKGLYITAIVIGCLVVIGLLLMFIIFGIGPTRFLPDVGAWYCLVAPIMLQIFPRKAVF